MTCTTKTAEWMKSANVTQQADGSWIAKTGGASVTGHGRTAVAALASVNKKLYKIIRGALAPCVPN